MIVDPLAKALSIKVLKNHTSNIHLFDSFDIFAYWEVYFLL